MDLQILKTFFMWCSILNIGLLIFTSLLWLFASDWIHGIHSKWFSIPKETFHVVFYCFIGIYKLLVYVFNIVPWIALVLMG